MKRLETIEILNGKIDNLDVKLDQKLEKLDTYMHSIDKTLIKQNADLEHHIKRTNQLEDQFIKINNRLEPIEDHAKKVSLIAKIVFGIFSAIIAVLGVFATVKDFLK